jgi:hypothetical protein
LNLEKEVRNLEKKWSNSDVMGTWDDEEDDDPKSSTNELEQEEEELASHLGSYHVVPILKWKISVGLERKFGPGECFINYGEDYQNKTVEEEEYFRLMLKRDKAMGYDPKKDHNRIF